MGRGIVRQRVTKSDIRFMHSDVKSRHPWPGTEAHSLLCSLGALLGCWATAREESLNAVAKRYRRWKESLGEPVSTFSPAPRPEPAPPQNPFLGNKSDVQRAAVDDKDDLLCRVTGWYARALEEKLAPVEVLVRLHKILLEELGV